MRKFKRIIRFVLMFMSLVAVSTFLALVISFRNFLNRDTTDRSPHPISTSLLQTIIPNNVQFLSQLSTLSGNEMTANIAFSPDSLYLASAPADFHGNTTRLAIWDVRTGEVSTTMEFQFDPLLDNYSIALVVFNSDGSILASSSHDGFVELWDTSTGERFAVSRRNQSGIMNLAFSPDENLLAYIDADGIVYLWEVETNEIRAFEVSNFITMATTFFMDRLTVAFLREGHIIIEGLNSDENGMEIRSSPLHIWGMEFSSNGDMLAVFSPDTNVKLFDTNTGEVIATFSILGVHDIVFSPNDSMLISVGGGVAIWDLQTQELIMRLPNGSTTVAISPDGKLLALADPVLITLWGVMQE